MATSFVTWAVALAAALTATDGAWACTLYHEQRRTVSQIVAGDTLVLDSGEEVKLVGALPPHAMGASPSTPAEAQTRSALTGIAAGHPVDIAVSGRRTDRYGRLLAQVFLVSEPQRDSGGPATTIAATWVQGRLVSDGWARAYALPGSTACLDDLLVAEQTARAGSRGHWATGAFVDRDASRITDLLALADTFQTITGKIAEVSNGTGSDRGATVLTFEPAPVAARRPDAIRPDAIRPDRSQPNAIRAMTVVIPQGVASSALPATSAAPADGSPAGRWKRKRATENWQHLINAEVRVRGWIEATANGPRISLTDAREIEVLTGERSATPPPTPPPKLTPELVPTSDEQSTPDAQQDPVAHIPEAKIPGTRR
ncbi:MAG: thermonuclease family protein [Hyphomicrobium aestuarii]|nr:thermonuclease family protein [Hyphomicrobium aestuarii]